MKKLESMGSEKFKISEDDLTVIKGGNVPASTWDSSYNYYYTYQDNTTTMDQSVYDICRDW
jgi:hypothetical protein